MVALLFSTCVFFVMLAFAADWGLINWERAQVQRSSDAATFALAWKCATRQPACASATAASTFARTVADANASDGKMAINGVCGKGGTGQAWLVGCSNPPVGATNYVRVTTGSLSAAGGYIQLPFTGVIDKTVGADRTTLTMTAQASWVFGGVAPSLVVFPAGAEGATTTLSFIKGNSNGNGYSLAIGPSVSACYFTPLPAVGVTMALDNSNNSSGALACADAGIASGSPLVAIVPTTNTRKIVSQWRSITTLTKSGQNLVVKWGPVISATKPTVTVLP